MSYSSGRRIYLVMCLPQLVAIAERQVFDFIGYLWIPILVNLLGIIFVILGLFGGFQSRPKYIIAYLLWQPLWIGWNVFLICLYLNLGGLDHMTNIVLKLDNQSESWWRSQGPKCKIKHNPDASNEVENCFLDYVHVEVFQAGLQSAFSILGSLFGICLVQRPNIDEEDTLSRKCSTRKTQRTALYSIEFSSELDSRLENGNDLNQLPPAMSPKPMTPRKVKRRSVMTRGTTTRHSTNSKRHSGGNRSSTRSSRRSIQNPITRLMEQQQSVAYDHSSLIDAALPNFNGLSTYGHANLTYQQSSTQSLNENDEFEDLYNNRPASVRSSYSNFHGTRAINYPTTSKSYHHSHATPQVPQKKNKSSRSSMRSKVFLNNGPPAYTSQVCPIDSETAI